MNNSYNCIQGNFDWPPHIWHSFHLPNLKLVVFINTLAMPILSCNIWWKPFHTFHGSTRLNHFPGPHGSCELMWDIAFVTRSPARCQLLNRLLRWRDAGMAWSCALSPDSGGNSDSKVHGADMEPIWGRQDPGGSHVGPVNFAIWESNACGLTAQPKYFYTHIRHHTSC